uniref:Amyloid-beta A4 precursor protein-binding family A member 3 n=1 Tax=Sphaeramia orbicularis TaxID=375764 RepID=A0A673BHX2_9TELE
MGLFLLSSSEEHIFVHVISVFACVVRICSSCCQIEVYGWHFLPHRFSYKMDSDVCSADHPGPAPSETRQSDSALVDVDSPAVVIRQPGAEAEDLDSYNPIEPPPLDWRSDSSSEAGSVDDLDDPGFPPSEDSLDKAGPDRLVLVPLDASQTVVQPDVDQQEEVGNDTIQDDEEGGGGEETEQAKAEDEVEVEAAEEHEGASRLDDEDHSRIHSLLNRLQLMGEEPPPSRRTPPHFAQHQYSALSDLEACAPSLIPDDSETTGLLFSENHQRDLLGLLQCTDLSTPPRPPRGSNRGDVDAVVSVSYMPGPCDPEDLLDGVIFGAKYLGSTQIKSDKNPSTNARMTQAQEAVERIKAPEGESQPMTEVDLFISTQRIKVLTADTQEAMMDHPLQMISYIADIGDIVVLMARRKRKGQDADSSSASQKKCLMICHVFTSDDAQTIAQAIGQAFGVAYQQFLQANGIKASDLRPSEYSDFLENQELYNGDLAHFSDSQNLRDVVITKAPGEILGLAVVESGWGSILPTVVVANLLHGGPAERCSELSIGDRIMSVNGTSLVGLPITTCQNIIRDLKSQKYVKLSIVHCPPVTMAIIRRPDPKFQLGFSVEDGIICSLMRGGIAERGGIRVGHRIIEINGQSVVAMPHEKIIQTLTNAVGEIHLKTMPASTYRLLTGQEQPVFL